MALVVVIVIVTEGGAIGGMFGRIRRMGGLGQQASALKGM